MSTPTPRLVLVDTVDELPGLLPLHAWEALRGCDLVILGSPDHPLVDHLEMAGEGHEVVPGDIGAQAVGRAELLAGLSQVDKARAGWIVDRAKDVGSIGYVFGADDTDAFTRTLGMEAAREAIEVEVVYFGIRPKGVELLRLVGVQERLLAPDGCPWDAEQTHATLVPYAIEEAHELAEAIAGGDPDDIAEELGDVLMQVTFHAELAETFDIDTVAGQIADKLVRRHPHVFADGQADTASDVEASWEDIKAAEKPERSGVFDGVPTGLPALALAAKVISRAERAGWPRPDAEQAADALAEAIGGVLAAEGTGDRDAEVGAVMLAAVRLARAAGTDPEHALRTAVGTMRSEAEAGLDGDAAPGNH